MPEPRKAQSNLGDLPLSSVPAGLQSKAPGTSAAAVRLETVGCLFTPEESIIWTDGQEGGSGEMCLLHLVRALQSAWALIGATQSFSNWIQFCL